MPIFDGGRPITHYTIEQKGKFEIEFSEVHVTKSPEPLEAYVAGLKENSVYEFRARAVNKAGPSKPCEPTPKHVCKHRNRKKITFLFSSLSYFMTKKKFIPIFNQELLSIN